jgi:hypothetical protein
MTTLERITAWIQKGDWAMYTKAGDRRIGRLAVKAFAKLEAATTEKQRIASVKWYFLAYWRLVEHNYASYAEAADTAVREGIWLFGIEMFKFATGRGEWYDDQSLEQMWQDATNKAYNERKIRQEKAS